MCYLLPRPMSRNVTSTPTTVAATATAAPTLIGLQPLVRTKGEVGWGGWDEVRLVGVGGLSGWSGVGSAEIGRDWPGLNLWCGVEWIGLG